MFFVNIPKLVHVFDTQEIKFSFSVTHALSACNSTIFFILRLNTRNINKLYSVLFFYALIPFWRAMIFFFLMCFTDQTVVTVQ